MGMVGRLYVERDAYEDMVSSVQYMSDLRHTLMYDVVYAIDQTLQRY